jgi:predicted nucleic acid-binding protein
MSNVSQVSAFQYRDLEADARSITPDVDDWPFFALSLKRDCALWSDDKKLKNQDRIKVLNTKDILDIIKS